MSNIGTWMQTVGAQWFLVGLPGAATLVALVQTADTLPDVLLAFPAGALADAFDRRRLLIILQLLQVAIGTGLTALTLTGHMTPALLLAFTFALGGASAMTLPPYQALIPELVPREQLPSASALGAISINLARAIGPALAGLLIARVGVGVVFGINTLAFLLLIGVLLVWRRPIEAAAQAPERFLPALRAGGRYVRYSPITRRILLRLGLFIVPATAVWALLPLVATRLLHLGSGGYGLLLGALGGGAVAGALLLPRFNSNLTPNGMLAAASAVYAGAMAVLGAGATSAPGLPGVAAGGSGMGGGDLQHERHDSAVPSGLGAGARPCGIPDRALWLASGGGTGVGTARRLGWIGHSVSAGRGPVTVDRRVSAALALVRHLRIESRCVATVA